MATTKTKSSAGNKAKWNARQISEAYLRDLLIRGKQPTSVFKFTDDLGIPEAEFYTFYSSFEAIAAKVWTSFMEETLVAIRSDSNYTTFTARDKLLAFYYTHLEILKRKRSFVVLRWPSVKQQPKTPVWLKSYKRMFSDFARELISEAIDQNEIKERPFLSDRYDRVFWFQLSFVIDFWKGDSSIDFDRTDAAVEKAVNLSFQLLGESTIDTAIDFAKFIWQSR